MYFHILTDPEVRRFIGGGAVPTPEDAWRHMAMLAGMWTLRGNGQWAIEEKASGEFVGRTGVWFPVGSPRSRPPGPSPTKHWGSGYATEAGRRLRAAFATLGVTHVISLIDPENVASRRVAEKLGGTIDKTGVFRGHETLFYGYTSPPA